MSIVGLRAFKDNYIWTLVNESQQSMLCVDPGDANPVLDYSKKNNLELTHILITHHHWDHIGGLEVLKNKFPQVEIFGPKDERIPLVDHVVKDEDLIHIAQHDFRVLSIPGHTSTHISYLEPSKHWLFCGDTLFSAGCGRVFDGSIKELFQSIELLKSLPDTTQVYCAHEYTLSNLHFASSIEPHNETVHSYAEHLKSQAIECSLPSSIALEKKINPFFRTSAPEIKKYAEKNGVNSNDAFQVFKLLRETKDNFS